MKCWSGFGVKRRFVRAERRDVMTARWVSRFCRGGEAGFFKKFDIPPRIANLGEIDEHG